MYASYRAIGGPDGLLALHEAFEGNTMSAKRDGDVYRVFSYATQIAAHRLDGKGTVFNDRKYSKTTTYHQNLCHAWL